MTAEGVTSDPSGANLTDITPPVFIAKTRAILKREH
jgi:hypothetical protein